MFSQTTACSTSVLRKGFCILSFISILFAARGCAPDQRTTTESSLSARQQVDNAECLTCHMDFQAELISAKHESVGIGCTSCHGDSLAHGDDELNITPPDRLFGRAEIVPFCKDCHPTHVEGKIYDEFVKKWHSERRPNGRMILDDSVCADCHGNHAILRVDQQQAIPE
jgi:hypothetical protein